MSQQQLTQLSNQLRSLSQEELIKLLLEVLLEQKKDTSTSKSDFYNLSKKLTKPKKEIPNKSWKELYQQTYQK